MAWDEWEQIRADAADRQSTQMQLNPSAPAGGGSSAPDLAASPAAKKKAAQAIEEEVEPGVRTGGMHADESTNAAVKEFGARDGYGWDTSGALKKAHETWGKQVKVLLDRLASEKYALSRTGIDFKSNEIDITAQLAGRSRITGS
ncbi:hypothetical protein ABZY06_04785 [Streptomyces sp. NPDC006540]|jgi:hypothetical protein|uniref:hypothetical protein n=1 Tax=Streptomyces sp. NPDC006540 TaxID=3155353 RepID=UPI0033A04132